MSRTKPKLSDLHPWLYERVLGAAQEYRKKYPNRALVVEYVFRTVEEQQRAFKRKFSKINGVNRFSRHNYGASGVPAALALDVHIHQLDGNNFDLEPLYEDNLPENVNSKVILFPQPKKSKGMSRADKKKRRQHARWIADQYREFGRIAETLGAFSGIINWGFDGPHLEVGKNDRIILLQRILKKKNFYTGMIDGSFGKKSRAALRLASRKYKIPNKVSWRQKRSFPIHPDLWVALHRE